MARARQRYIITGNMSFNGHDLRGQVVVDLGECTSSGRLKSASPKPLKRELTHHLLRFEDRKWLKAHGIPATTITVAKTGIIDMAWAVTLQDTPPA